MTGERAKESIKGPLSDDPSVAETFADEFVGFFVRGSNFHLTLATTRADIEDSSKHLRKVTARLVIPLQASMDIYSALGNALAVLEKQGLIKRPIPSGEKVQ
jgi:hypothetical protein